MFIFNRYNEIENELLKEDFILFDLGARGGLGYPWGNVRSSKLITFGFEPENAEFLELTKINKSHKNTFNFGISNKDETSNLYVTREPGCSSTLRPNREVLDKFHLSSNWDIRDIFKIETQRLDTFLNKSGICPDAIKIDVQGLSFQVIEGMGEKLYDFILIEAECEFRQIYENQSLFHDVSKFLDEKGYILLDLKRYWANGKNIPLRNHSQGQIIFCDAVWVIGPSKFYELIQSGKLNQSKIYKMIFALIVYGFYDLALDFINFNVSFLSDKERSKYSELIVKIAHKGSKLYFRNDFILKVINIISFIFENISNNLKMDKSLNGWNSDLHRRNSSLLKISYDKFRKS